MNVDLPLRGVPELSITVSHDYQIINYKLFRYDVTSPSIIEEANIPKLVIVLIANRSKMIVSLLDIDSSRIIIYYLTWSSSRMIGILLILHMLK